MRKIGILGGTFNPIHNGHIELAEKAKKLFDLDRVVFVPSGLPPHKSDKDILDKEFRYKMVKLAIEKNPYFSVSRVEIDRRGHSYAIDTFKQLKKKFGSRTKLYYIMGIDSIVDILNWRKPLELFKLCEFIVATRPGTKFKTFKRMIKFPPIKQNIDKIHFFEMKINISSTDIRKRIKHGLSVKDLIPPKVEKFISENKLYK